MNRVSAQVETRMVIPQKVALRGVPTGMANGLNVVLAVLLAGLGGGCETAKNASFTYKLWDKDVRSYCQPAANPELALYEANPPRDVLVEYSALSDREDQIKRLAYFLDASQKRIAAGNAPQFVDPKLSRKLTAIPKQVSTNTYALIGTNGWTFTMYRPGREPQVCNLPTYRDDHNTAGRVALTPLAVAGDATIIGVVAAVFMGYAYAQDGGPVR
jgi:hypothetical protein